MLSTPVPAQVDRSLPGPHDITRVELPNGIVVLSRPNFNSPSVIIDGYLKAGAISEPDAQLGLSEFTAASLLYGTQNRSYHEIYESIESAAANLSMSGGMHTTSFFGRSLAEDLDLLLDLLSDSLRRPTFPQEHVERLRAQLLTGLAIRAQDTSEMAALTFDGLIYPRHPYRRPQDGFPETIQAIQVGDLAQFHRLHYGPRGLVIAVVGAVDPKVAVEKVAHHLGDWDNPLQAGQPQLPDLLPLERIHRQDVTIPGKSQSDLILGAPGPSRPSPDFLAASLGNSVLGQFGMMGRVGEVVREKAGLAYHVGSSLSGGAGPGPWTVSAGVDPAHVDQVIDMLRAEIKRFVSEPVSEQELSDSQANFVGRLPLSLETNAGVAAALVRLERYHLGLDYYQRYPALIQSITPGEILEAAGRYLHPDRLGIAAAGPGQP